MAKTITIFEVEDIALAGSGQRPMYHRGEPKQGFRATEKSIEELQDHMTGFIEGVQQILAKGSEVVGQFQMETVEVQAQIGVEGKIGFLGTGASASGTSQIKIIFTRNKQ